MKVKLNKSKNIDSKILRLSPPNEKGKELSNSSIREDEYVEFMTKLKILLKDMTFSQNSEWNFYRGNNPTPENENIKTKSPVRLPKHERLPMEMRRIGSVFGIVLIQVILEILI